MRSPKNTLIREILPLLEKNANHKGDIWYDLPGCSYSDYSGCAAEVAAAKFFSEKYQLDHRWGGYGSRWVHIDVKQLLGMTLDKLEDFKADLVSLADYPVIDEDLHSEIEMENINECKENGLFDLPYTITQSWKIYYPIEVLNATIDEKGEVSLNDYCVTNQASILEEFRKNEWIEYSGGNNFCLNWNNDPIPNDLLPENNGYRQVGGNTISGLPLKGWIK